MNSQSFKLTYLLITNNDVNAETIHPGHFSMWKEGSDLQGPGHLFPFSIFQPKNNRKGHFWLTNSNQRLHSWAVVLLNFLAICLCKSRDTFKYGDCGIVWRDKASLLVILCSEGFKEKSPLISQTNDVWEMSAKILYWWHITTQIWVVLLIDGSKFPMRHDQLEALPRSG